MARLWLDYEKEIMEAMLMERDVMVILAKGIGLQSIVGKCMELYSQPTNLTLCLNASHDAERYVEALRAQGLSNERLPQVITNKCTVHERKLMYKSGGCIIITSRILVVDMLNHSIDISMISGLLMCHAHKVSDSSVEAFILRLFREVNRNGFVKAFSDDAISFSSGFNKVEQAMKLMYLRKVLLYPRFHMAVGTCLEQHQPDVYEIQVAMTPLMIEMQQALLVATEATLNELKRSCKDLDETDLTIQNALTKALDVILKRQLTSIWHQLPAKTKQLSADLTHLRQLLSYLTRYDAITFYSYLLTQKKLSGQQRIPSPWLFSEAADRLFTAAKKRLYLLHKTKKANEYDLQLALELNPKWASLLELLGDFEPRPASSSGRVSGAETLVMLRDDRTASQLREILYMGGLAMMKKRFGRYLKHKNESMVNNLSSFSVEQKLLRDLAATLLIPDVGSHHTTTTSQGKRKAAAESTESFVHDVASYGMPLDELIYLSSQQDAKKPKPSGHLGTLPPQDQLVLCTYAEADKLPNLLDDLHPSHIVLYDPDVGFIRQLEVFNACNSAHDSRGQQHPVQVYFMVYENSAEQQTYLTQVKREHDAFERLIQQKEHLVIPLNVFDIPAHVKRKKQSVQYSLDTRTGGRATSAISSQVVVVDVREFRSALPSMLHKEGLVLHPVTIEVGDYILSPRICVERKSISDLFGSLANGRLFNQAEMMLRHYQVPVLLIEFTPEKPFSLQVRGGDVMYV
ncbi:hypothetical protein, variant 1 [Aphanomyces astaci]|uniref:ERCC4 domain-containing protein n=1 Tax=Aphanomyces astaci TaxID=112090 RepID=W4GQL7_APHAT|nr:hypothetical protein, variant 1 [Aphanomyces astaci]ETV81611.1 hypothetical protein, variant 1 [Aphanomyces astaci]|eukprot:XP_009829470.1 hypothetical protein, variant 1 [Aphanomyces astaci]